MKKRYHLGHPPRLRGWDYTLSAPYFVTFKVRDRRPCLARIGLGPEIVLTPMGKVVQTCWRELPARFNRVRLDALAIMPDHVHAILILIEESRAEIADSRAEIEDSGAEIEDSGAEIEESRVKIADSSGALMHQGSTKERNQRYIQENQKCKEDCQRSAGVVFTPLMSIPGQHLGKVVRAWKAKATGIIRRDLDPDFSWQSRYYDRIIRSKRELWIVRRYIANNQKNWIEQKQ